MLKKLAIISTHPIQYYAPVFKILSQNIMVKVFYTGGEQLVNQLDRGFRQSITWDISLLDSYNYSFLTNIASEPGSHHFNGINNSDAIAQIEGFEPDALLIYGWSNRSHLRLINYFSGKISIYFRGDSTLLDQKINFKSLLKRLLLKWVYSHVDKAFYVGTANKAYFKNFGLKEKQLIFAPHAIDNVRFSECRANEAHKLRERLGVLQNDILILFAGKLEKKKNPEILLNAFIELDLPNTHLLFVGNGELEKSLKSKVESLKFDDVHQKAHHYNTEKDPQFKNEDLENSEVVRKPQDDINKGSLEFIYPLNPSKEGPSKTLKERIHFMSFQNQTEMPVIYQTCDLFCLPSKGPGETWGLAVNEAMAAGKAVLVSNKVGCSLDLVKSHINGEIFISENIEDLKNKLSHLVFDQDILVQYGNASKEIIKDWSFEKQVNSFLNSINP